MSTTPTKIDDSSSTSPQQQQEQPRFRLKVWQGLTEAQDAHGLNLHDYGLYHQYCTQRLKRIRHHQAVRHLLVNSVKVQQQQQSLGKDNKSASSKHEYRGPSQPIPREPTTGQISHPYLLWNALVQAERAWAVACDYQQQQQQQQQSSSSLLLLSSNRKPPTRAQIVSKLRKAVSWTRVLVLTAPECCVEETQLELQAYDAWMRGNGHLQSHRYRDALECYSTSRTILLNLTSQSQDLALQDIWTSKANSLLLPLVRFCQYETPQEDTTSTTTNRQQQHSNTTEEEEEGGKIVVEFANQRIALDDHPQLAVLYLQLEDDESSNSQQYLSVLDQALSLTRLELERYTKLPDGPAVRAKRQHWQTLQAYFRHLQWDNQRHQHEQRFQKLWQAQQQAHAQQSSSLSSAEETKQDDDILATSPLEQTTQLVHMADVLLQTVQAMAETLSQATSATDSDYNPEDDEQWLQAQAHVVRIRALRCAPLARYYELAEQPRHAVVLVKQAMQLQRRALEEVQACEWPTREIESMYETQLHQLQQLLQAMQCRLQAAQWLRQMASSDGNSSTNSSNIIRATDRPLWLRLSDLDPGHVGSRAAWADHDTPQIIPIPAKPVFYDVAWELATTTTSSQGKILDYTRQHQEWRRLDEEARRKAAQKGWFSALWGNK